MECKFGSKNKWTKIKIKSLRYNKQKDFTGALRGALDLRLHADVVVKNSREQRILSEE